MGALGRQRYNGERRLRVQREEIVPAFARLGGDLAGCRVLEIGAGRGAGAELAIVELGAARVDLVDLDESMSGLSATRLMGQPAAVVCADSTVLPFASARYDAVISFGGIHLADDWRKILWEIARVLRANGRFLFEQPINPMPVLAVGSRRGGRVPGGFGRSELLGALADVGLRVEATAVRGTGRLDLLGVARRAS